MRGPSPWVTSDQAPHRPMVSRLWMVAPSWTTVTFGYAGQVKAGALPPHPRDEALRVGRLRVSVVVVAVLRCRDDRPLRGSAGCRVLRQNGCPTARGGSQAVGLGSHRVKSRTAVQRLSPD